MINLWVTVPVNDIRIIMPVSMEDHNVNFMLRDVETIDSVIAQLESIKESIDDSVEHFV